jgi:glycosyltransferase involved in cell wall biosynthesis
VLKALHETTELSIPKKNFFSTVRAIWRLRKGQTHLLLLQPTQDVILPILFLKPFLSLKIIGDAFISLYDTYVCDRALARPWGIKAMYYFLLDWLLVHLSDVILCDTDENKEFFCTRFHADKNNVRVLPVAVDMDMMDNVMSKKLPHAREGEFHVLFCGYYIPLQGVEYIIEAANLLRADTHLYFTLIGSGQTRKHTEALAKQYGLHNVTFMDRVPYLELLALMRGADLSLGIFGQSAKAQRVIPNKVVEAASLGVPIVTGDNPPLARYFTGGKNIFFSRMADSADLAKTIREAYNTKELKEIGREGKRVAEAHFTTTQLKHILAHL